MAMETPPTSQKEPNKRDLRIARRKQPRMCEWRPFLLGAGNRCGTKIAAVEVSIGTIICSKFRARAENLPGLHAHAGEKLPTWEVHPRCEMLHTGKRRRMITDTVCREESIVVC